MLVESSCAFVCFIVVPLFVAFLAFRRGNDAIGVLCVISVFLGVGPLVALLALFNLFGKRRSLDVSLIVLGTIVLYMLLYMVRHYFVF